MSNGLSGFEEGGEGKKLYTAKVKAKAQATTSCSFCWFVLQVNPSLKGMSQRDEATYKEHLKRSHGLRGEIEQ